MLGVGGQIWIAFLVPRYEGVVLVWKWSIIYKAMAIGMIGSKAFAVFAVFVMLETVSNASHIEADVEYSARHDGQMLDGDRTDAIKNHNGVVKVKSVV